MDAGEVQDLLDAAARDAVRVGQGHQVVVGGAARVHGPRFEEPAHLVEGRGVRGVVAVADGHAPAGRGVEADDHPHGGGFARAVGAEEAGDGPGGR